MIGLKKIDKYIIKKMLYAIFIMIMIISLISFVFAFLSENYLIGKNNYSYFDALVYITTKVIYQSKDIFMLSGLLGSISSLYFFSKNNEIIAIQMSKISTRKMIYPVFIVGLIFFIFTFAFNNFIGPKFFHYGSSFKSRKLDKPLINTKTGTIWIKYKNNLISIRKKNINNNLLNVNKITLDNGKISKISIAKYVYLHNNKWHAHNIKIIKTLNNSNNKKLNITYKKNDIWNISISRQVLNFISLPEDQLNSFNIIKVS